MTLGPSPRRGAAPDAQPGRRGGEPRRAVAPVEAPGGLGRGPSGPGPAVLPGDLDRAGAGRRARFVPDACRRRPEPRVRGGRRRLGGAGRLGAIGGRVASSRPPRGASGRRFPAVHVCSALPSASCGMLQSMREQLVARDGCLAATGGPMMARRPPRSQFVHQLISPVRTRVRSSMPRLRRTLSGGQVRWPIARWVQRRRTRPGTRFEPGRQG